MQTSGNRKLPGEQETLAKEPSLIPRLSSFAQSLCGWACCSIYVPTVCAAGLTGTEPRGGVLKFVTVLCTRLRPPGPRLTLCKTCWSLQCGSGASTSSCASWGVGMTSAYGDALTLDDLPRLEHNLALLEFRTWMLIVPTENKVHLLSGMHLCS